jgi:hypothetical protein
MGGNYVIESFRTLCIINAMRDPINVNLTGFIIVLVSVSAPGSGAVSDVDNARDQ